MFIFLKAQGTEKSSHWHEKEAISQYSFSVIWTLDTAQASCSILFHHHISSDSCKNNNHRANLYWISLIQPNRYFLILSSILSRLLYEDCISFFFSFFLSYCLSTFFFCVGLSVTLIANLLWSVLGM